MLESKNVLLDIGKPQTQLRQYLQGLERALKEKIQSNFQLCLAMRQQT